MGIKVAVTFTTLIISRVYDYVHEKRIKAEAKRHFFCTTVRMVVVSKRIESWELYLEKESHPVRKYGKPTYGKLDNNLRKGHFFVD